jgi:hypothetical protein
METIFELCCPIHGRIRDLRHPDPGLESEPCSVIVGDGCCGTPMSVVEIDGSDRLFCTVTD